MHDDDDDDLNTDDELVEINRVEEQAFKRSPSPKKATRKRKSKKERAGSSSRQLRSHTRVTLDYKFSDDDLDQQYGNAWMEY